MKTPAERKMPGPKPIWTERFLVTMVPGTLAKIETVLEESEKPVHFIREAIDENLKRRQRRIKSK